MNETGTILMLAILIVWLMNSPRGKAFLAVLRAQPGQPGAV